MLKDEKTTGLCDKDVQLDVLAKGKDLTTFQQVYSHIEVYEEGKRAKSELSGGLSEVNARSKVSVQKDAVRQWQ